MDRRRLLLLLAGLLILGAAVRTVDVWRPVDGSIRAAWREADVAAMARNFYREGMDIRYPRIDWRGTGPGFVESEFPLYPWTVAWIYHLAGVHEQLARVVSWCLSLAALAIFLALCLRLLGPLGTAAAGLFYVLSPMEIRLATAIQPEPLMQAAFLAAVWAFIRWLDDGRRRDYLLALGCTALAILAKASALQIGILLLALLLHRHGLKAFRRADIWIFGALALLPGLLWYRHAHELWLLYGNSAGVSNESHWIGWDFFTSSRFLKAIVAADIRGVWTLAGLLAAAVAVIRRPRDRVVRVALYWFGSAMLFYLAAARTTGDRWALYYHVFTLAPAALLIGAGAEAARDLLRTPGTRRGIPRLAGGLTVLALAGAYGLEARQVVRDFHPHPLAGLYRCAGEFAPKIPPGSLILASGGPCTDETGRRVAWNASYMFYWMDRKGFNVCHGRQSLATVRAYADSGAAFFVAEKDALARAPGVEARLRTAFPVAAECRHAILFDLRHAY